MKKVLSIILCMSLCIMFSMPVFAASSSVLKNIRLSINRTPFSLGSLSGEDIQVTQVKISIRMSSGSGSLPVICLESPNGTVLKFKPSLSSATYSTNYFNGENPKGTWYAWLEVEETAQIQYTTMSVSVAVDYSY